MEIVHACLAEAVDAAFAKRYEFAEEVDKGTTEVSYRLRRAVDSNGDLKVAPLDWVGIVATRPAGKDTFIRALARAWGYDVRLAAPASPDEQVRRLARELPEHRRRDMERELRLEPGSLG